MIRKKFLRPISSILLMVYFASCTTTYEVTRRSELDTPGDLGELTVRTKDGKEYTLEHYSLNDSTLSCIGEVSEGSLTKPFSGKLELSKIKQIEASQTNLEKNILLVGVGTVLLVTFLTFWNKQDDGLKNEVKIKYPRGGGFGCMAVRDNFYLENENRLNAAGLKNMINIKSTNSGKVMYLNIMKDSDTFHFKVLEDVNQIEIVMVDEFPSNVDNSDVLTIELSK